MLGFTRVHVSRSLLAVLEGARRKINKSVFLYSVSKLTMTSLNPVSKYACLIISPQVMYLCMMLLNSSRVLKSEVKFVVPLK